jgi:para-aminobenzoate synthetase component 1
LFARHESEPWPFLLDRAGSTSYAGSRPSAQLVVEANGAVRRWDAGRWRSLSLDPIEAISDFVAAGAAEPLSIPSDLPATETLPRTVGFLAYELGAGIARLPIGGPDPAGLPLAVLSTYDRIDAWSPGTDAIRNVEFTRAAPTTAPPPLCEHLALAPVPDGGACLSRYRAAFARIQQAIRAGDIYQANLARRIDLELRVRAVVAYARLRRRQPVPHGAFLDCGGRQILSNSPEAFLRVHGDVVETFPVKGTRPRCDDDAADRRAADELAADPKERAEHLMIVDLERNDLGRVARIGSVEVPVFAEVSSYATVHHLVSVVRARLRPECTVADILRATFPGGSITGAPKLRAMEIIAEVEALGRGVYTGAIGCWNGPRAFDLNVAIRTAVAGAGRIQYAAGGGIVADSRLEAEYDETACKARAFLEALCEARA